MRASLRSRFGGLGEAFRGQRIQHAGIIGLRPLLAARGHGGRLAQRLGERVTRGEQVLGPVQRDRAGDAGLGGAAQERGDGVACPGPGGGLEQGVGLLHRPGHQRQKRDLGQRPGLAGARIGLARGNRGDRIGGLFKAGRLHIGATHADLRRVGRGLHRLGGALARIGRRAGHVADLQQEEGGLRIALGGGERVESGVGTAFAPMRDGGVDRMGLRVHDRYSHHAARRPPSAASAVDAARPSA